MERTSFLMEIENFFEFFIIRYIYKIKKNDMGGGLNRFTQNRIYSDFGLYTDYNV